MGIVPNGFCLKCDLSRFLRTIGGKNVNLNLIYINWLLLVPLKLENGWTDLANFGFEIFVKIWKNARKIVKTTILFSLTNSSYLSNNQQISFFVTLVTLFTKQMSLLSYYFKSIYTRGISLTDFQWSLLKNPGSAESMHLPVESQSSTNDLFLLIPYNEYNYVRSKEYLPNFSL